MRTTVAAVAACMAIAATAPLRAQHDDGAIDAAQIGSDHVNFQTSCAPAVREDFNRGIALLHSFWFQEAIKAFGEVARADPDCALAWWGTALAQWGNPFAGLRGADVIARGQASIAKAQGTGKPDARERELIEALALLYGSADPATQPGRLRQYEAAMGRLAGTWPQDVELQIFHALAIAQAASPTDQAYAALLRAAAILDPLFERYPQHPGLAHYIIHAYDVPPLAARALVAARRYASLAPAVPHALHMPSHTFSRIGSWDESIDSNLRSADASRRHNSAVDELHALDYLAYAYLQTGRDEAARSVAQQAARIAQALPRDVPNPNPFAVAAIPARVALERGDWLAAAQLAPWPGLSPSATAITHFARALGASLGGQPAAATADIERLAELQRQLTAAADHYWADQVGIQHDEALAVQRFAQGQSAAALALLADAAARQDRTDKAAVTPGPFAPAREMLGELQLAAGQLRDALRSFEEVLAREPNRFRALAGAARAAQLSGDQDKARGYHAQLLTVAAKADTERPELLQARRAVADAAR